MFVITESFMSALASIRAHGLRSFLTMLGIIIGVASVIAMVSIIQGLNHSVSQQLEGLGANSIMINSFTPREELLKGRRARLTPEDLTAISQRIDGIESITPFLPGQGGALRYGSQTAATNVMGTTYAYQDIQQYYVKIGRFLSVSDNQTRRRVMVIGEETRKKLALPENPLNEYVEYGGEWVKIIGLLEPKGTLVGQDLDDLAVIPFSTMRSLRGAQNEADILIQLTVSNLDNIDTVVDQIRRLLRKQHGLTTERDDFNIQTADQMKDMIGAITTQITAVMGGILGISLLVGGIGIMNIMLVSVTERTREIGICKAIGAKRHHVLLQFLFESVFLCLLGGLIGLLIGYGFGAMVASMVQDLPAAHVPLWAIVLAFGFSAGVGIIFGILPAAKAANLDPIEALRYE
ncbi:MAG: ABC transporter permease [Cellvibrionaceae bacterium]